MRARALAAAGALRPPQHGRSTFDAGTGQASRHVTIEGLDAHEAASEEAAKDSFDQPLRLPGDHGVG